MGEVAHAGELSAVFAACRAEQRAALVLFTTSGHPSAAATLDVLHMLAGAGADVIELGVPFSDPLADGPVIQASSDRAIQQGVDLGWTLQTLARFREQSPTPVVLFSYLNPVLRYGVDRFVAESTSAGANGLLLTDLPLGAEPELERRLADSPLDLIRLIAPTTPASRAREIAASARGFLYYISRTGVTGEKTELTAGLEREIAGLRQITRLPIAVGFGISTPEQAASVARFADGVVVGSALVRALETGSIADAERFVRGLRAAMVR
jgi:tryptophan synthase alpha chain